MIPRKLRVLALTGGGAGCQGMLVDEMWGNISFFIGNPCVKLGSWTLECPKLKWFRRKIYEHLLIPLL